MKLKAKEEQRNKYADNIVKLENKLREKQAEIQQLKKELENVKKENQINKNQIQETVSKMSELEDKIRDMEEENENKKKETLERLANLTEENDNLTTKYQKQLVEIDMLKSEHLKPHNDSVLCHVCQRKITNDPNNHKARQKDSGKVSRKEGRRDSDISSLTETEQKFLQRIKAQNQQSQTRLFVNDNESPVAGSRGRTPAQIRKPIQCHPSLRVRQGPMLAQHMSKQHTASVSKDVNGSFGPNFTTRMALPVKPASILRNRKFQGF